jgi:hypothetical protein
MVSAIAPGMVRTPMLTDLSQERLSQLTAGYPGGRLPEVRGVIGAGAAR